MKKTLVIIPGWGGNGKTWKEFSEIASEKFDVHVIDLPCFGDEPCPKEIWGVEEYADFVKSKVKGLKSKVLLGHSFGGQIAAYLTADNPNICEKLILSGAAIYRPKKWVRRTIFFIIAKVGKTIFRIPNIEKFEFWARKVLYKVADSPDYSQTVEIKRDIFKKIVRQDVSDVLPKIKCKTLVVWGSKDKYIPLRFGKKIAKKIPNAELHIFKNGKHGLHLQKPKELLKVILDFVK